MSASTAPICRPPPVTGTGSAQGLTPPSRSCSRTVSPGRGGRNPTRSRDVATEILGAAGVAENAFNDGLVRGFIYGEKHSAAQSNELRQKAFNAVLKSTGHTPGHYEGDDVYTFGRGDVYAFAGALRPAANAVLQEADRRLAARLERERLAKHAKEVEKRFGTGASWPR